MDPTSKDTLTTSKDSEAYSEINSTLELPNLGEIQARTAELAAQGLLASSKCDWIHFSMFAGIGTSSHAIAQNVKEAAPTARSDASMDAMQRMATYFFEIESDNRDVLQHHFHENSLNKVFDDAMILVQDRFITLLAILLHHKVALRNVLITSGSPCQDLSSINLTRPGSRGNMSGLFCT